jgi:hypothetical protein
MFFLTETEPAFSDRRILFANLANNQPLSPHPCPYQIIVPDEKRRARWVKMVKAIRVLEVPSPK